MSDAYRLEFPKTSWHVRVERPVATLSLAFSQRDAARSDDSGDDDEVPPFARERGAGRRWLDSPG